MSLRLLASYLALTVVVLLALEVPLAIVDARNERQDLTAKVERDAFAVSSLAEDVLQRGGRSPALLALARGYDERTNGRVVVVASHRPAVLAAADLRVDVGSASVAVTSGARG